jgi:hypothetical protein
MFHRIKSVQPLPDMVLRVEFICGIIKCYDVKPLVYKWEVFKDLTQCGLFNLVSVDAGGYGVVWNEYIDLACNELWDNGSVINTEVLSEFSCPHEHVD